LLYALQARNIPETLERENNIRTDFQEIGNVKGWLLKEFEEGEVFF
jgi:hypothetical protein